ncbi:MAG TPA: D-alanine--D-alanine ligase [Actinomycetota bacterium]|nr:D-alanine--D-alanine ligase [Actinomycetota bacterium]
MNVAVLAGGRTPERDVSLRGGHRVAGALPDLGHDVTLIDPGETALAEALQERSPDLCYLTLHGKEGEDGTVQRLLDLLGLAYTGTAAFDCEVAFDKLLAKDALDRAGVRTPTWAPIEGTALRDLGAGAALGRAIERVGLPCVVKPSRSGSALGVTSVSREGDLPAAVMAALSFSGGAVVETAIVGTEIAVGVVGTPGEALPAVEIVPKGGTYDYAARYTAGATDYFAPARLGDDATAACRDAAMAAWRALGLRDVTRVDMIVDRDGVPWVLEVNVSPGMTETSLLPMGASAAGMELAQLCDAVIQSVTSRRLGR